MKFKRDNGLQWSMTLHLYAQREKSHHHWLPSADVWQWKESAEY
jgi:hypothetical protein